MAVKQRYFLVIFILTTRINYWLQRKGKKKKTCLGRLCCIKEEVLYVCNDKWHWLHFHYKCVQNFVDIPLKSNKNSFVIAVLPLHNKKHS